jgi:FtsH-binding integral membrane protein
MNKNKTSVVSRNQQVKPLEEQSTLFTRENYKWMLIGLIIMAIGFFLMAGGKSADPSVFNDNEIYSFRRITLAPILIVAGLVIEIFAIIKRQK